MKREIGQGAVVVLVVAIVAAIVGGAIGYLLAPTLEEPEKPKPTLVLMGTFREDHIPYMEAMLEPFTAETGIEVKLVRQSGAALQTGCITSFIAEKTPADIVYCPWPGWIKSLVAEGYLMDITDSVDETKFRDLWLDRTRVDGKLYAAPAGTYANPGFFYKKSLFDEHNLTVPTTYGEFKTLLDTLKTIPGVEAPIAASDVKGWPLTNIVEAWIIGRGSPQLQLDLISGDASFTDSQVREIFEEVVNVIDAGYFSTVDDFATQLEKFWAGDYALFPFVGNWALVKLAGYPEISDLGVFGFPESTGMTGNADHIFIPKYTEHPEETKELFEHLLSAESQEIWHEHGPFVSPHLDVPRDVYPESIKDFYDLLTDPELLVLDDLDDTIGGAFQLTMWDQLKLLWADPTRLDEILTNIEAARPT